MPLEGEKLDELLTGLLDDRLDGIERRLVEQAMADDPSIGSRYSELQQLRDDLRAGATPIAAHSLPSDFSTRVIRAAQQQAREIDLPAEHHLLHSPTVQRAVVQDRRWVHHPVRLAGYLAAAAAAILWIIGSLDLAGDSDDGQPLVQNPETSGAPAETPRTAPSETPRTAPSETPRTAPSEASPASTTYVGDPAFRMSYALIVEVQATRAALRDGVLESVLQQSGIAVAPPIVADPAVEQALQDTRLIVQPAGGDAGESMFYFVRADAKDLDSALRQVWADRISFPNVGFDLAIDNPQTRLMDRIAKATGRRFTAKESFAAPLATIDTGGDVQAQFDGQPATGRFVSNASRAKGWAGESLSTGGLNFGPQLASVLIVVRGLP